VIGERINNYQIVSILGEGGMGTVYVAEHPFMGRKAAIKVLRQELAKDRNLVERFMNEARAANAIGHPNIIDIIDVGLLPSGVPYLMMEFLVGESLSLRIMRRRPMPVAEALDVAAQTASALAAAHEKNIVHRDLKPDNLFLIGDRANPTGRIKVLDFGIAKLRGELSGSGARTQTGSILGTPPYMSPEQCRGVDELDHRTDIYALGIILYEMLTGAPPFVSPGWGEVVHMHITEPPPPLRRKNPSVSPQLEKVVLKALAKQPADRWSSMGELEAALRGVPGWTHVPGTKPVSAPMNAAVGPAMPTSPTTLKSSTGQMTTFPETPGARSRRRLAALVIGGFVAAGIAAAVLFGMRGGPQPIAPVATTPVPAATAPVRPAPAVHDPVAPIPAAAPPGAAPPVAIPAALPSAEPSGQEVELHRAGERPRPAAPVETPSKKKTAKAAARPSHHAIAPETAPAAAPATLPPPAATPPPPAATPPPAKKPDCNPNYYFDVQGRKHFKPECF